MADKTDTPVSDDPIWREALDWLLRLQAAPDDSRLAQQHDHWLKQNPAHGEAYRKAQRVWRLTGDVPAAFPVPARGVARPTTARHSPIRPGPIRHGRMMIGAALAAGIALFAVPDIRRALWSDYHTGTAETRELALTDGSTVTLGAESAIDTAFSPDSRAVTLLSGQAFFQVAADAGRPFTVDAGTVRVTVTGTAFDVHATSDAVVVEVQSGTVTVSRAGGKSPEKPLILKRGERARLPRHGDVATTEAISPAQVGLWRSGRMAVNGATIGEVVDELQRYHRGFIVMRDDGLARRRVTGVIDLADPEAALNAVVQPHGGTVRQRLPFVLTVQPR